MTTETTQLEKLLDSGFYELRYSGKRSNRQHSHVCSVSQKGYSRCGIWCEWGTGNQEEYERAAELPVCATCMGLIT